MRYLAAWGIFLQEVAYVFKSLWYFSEYILYLISWITHRYSSLILKENNISLLNTFSSCQHQLQQMFVLLNRKQQYLSCSINKQRPGQQYLTVKTGSSIEVLQPFKKQTHFPPALLTDAEAEVFVHIWDSGEQADYGSQCLSVYATSKSRVGIPGSLTTDWETAETEWKCPFFCNDKKKQKTGEAAARCQKKQRFRLNTLMQADSSTALQLLHWINT